MAVATLAVSVLLTACWLFTPSTRLLVLATAFVPLALPGYAVAGVAWWMLHRRSGRRRDRRVRWETTVPLAMCLLGAGLHAALLVPSYAGSHVTGRADLTVLTSNLRLGLADTSEVTRIAERADADVVVLEEVTPAAFVRLAPLRRVLPHVAGAPSAGGRGTVVLSRYPLSGATPLAVFNGGWAVRVAAPEPFSLLAVHVSEPEVAPWAWSADHRALAAAAVSALRQGPVVVAGDFNATLDHRPMRDLVGLGLGDAAREANAGWQPTWPSGSDAVHALPFGLGALAIDHVLVSDEFSAISSQTFPVPRSDHRALLARFAVR